MEWLRRLFGGNDRAEDERLKSKSGFGEAVVAALRERGWPEPITFDLEVFRIDTGNGNKFHLHNCFEEASADWSEAQEVIDSFVGIFTPQNTLPDTFEEAAPRLIPIVRETYYLDASGERKFLIPGKEADFPYKPLTPELAATVAWNGPDVLVALTNGGFEMWGTPFDDAYARAMENLNQWSFQSFRKMARGVMALEDPEGIATSAFLRPDILASAGIAGTPVVMMPGRNTLFIADANDRRGLASMADAADEILAEPRPLTGFSFVPDGDGWRQFPRSDEDTDEALRELNLEWLARTYRVQGEHIEELQQEAVSEEASDELLYLDWLMGFVATFNLFQIEGKWRSYAVWTNTSQSLLPKADYVFFSDPLTEDFDTHFAPWEAAWGAFHDLMLPVGLNPERYFAETFPDLEEIKRIAVPLD